MKMFGRAKVDVDQLINLLNKKFYGMKTETEHFS